MSSDPTVGYECVTDQPESFVVCSKPSYCTTHATYGTGMAEY